MKKTAIIMAALLFLPAAIVPAAAQSPIGEGGGLQHVRQKTGPNRKLPQAPAPSPGESKAAPAAPFSER